MDRQSSGFFKDGRCPHREESDAYPDFASCALIKTLNEGYALMEIHRDPSGNPVDFLIHYVNPAWEKRTGLKAEALIGPLGTTVIPGITQEIINLFARVALKGETIEVEKFFCPCGHQCSASFHPLENGRFYMILYDTACARLPETNEKLLQAAVEQSGLSIVITDAQANIEYVNPFFTSLTGYSKEEAQGQNPRILKTDENPPALYKELWSTLLAGKSWKGKFCNKKKNGEKYWEIATITPIQGADKSLHYLGVKEDITEKLHLSHANDTFQSMFDLVDEVLFTLDVHGKLTYSNQSLKKLSGGPFSNNTPKNLWRILKVQSPVRLYYEIKQSIRTQHFWKGKLDILNKDGHKRILAGTLTFIQKNGFEPFLAGIFRDVSLDVEIERHLRNREKMEALGSLARGVAHDFNNNLTSILNAAELLVKEIPEDNSAHVKLKVILQAGLQAKQMTRRILGFSEASQEKYVPFDLSAVFRETALLLESSAGNGVEIRTNIASSIWIQGDPAQIQQMIMNIAINGLQAITHNGYLKLELYESPNTHTAVINIRDNGKGMEPEVAGRAFEPFFTTKAPANSGLGLSVAHSIATQCGGEIRLKSEINKGTLVQIKLPCLQSEIHSVTTPLEKEVLSEGHILLVDLEELRAALTKGALQDLGFRITAHSDPFAALDALRDHPAVFDAVVVEYSKGVISGEELSRKIKKLRPDLPILFCSGLADNKSEDHPFDAFLIKPFTIREMAQTLNHLLKQPRSHPKESIQTRTTPQPQPTKKPSGEATDILLVEDSPVSLALLRSWLELGGYSVKSARDGQEAWETFSELGPGTFSLVLSDITMPRMDGFHLVERIRELDTEIPVVLFSSSEDSTTIRSVLHSHVSEFLIKPFTSEKLLTCVKRLASKSRAKQRTDETAKAVRQAQRAMTAMPEKDLPVYSVHHSLTDAGGDIFRCFEQKDDSILFILADVAGHSVISSYAVAAFLGLLSSLAGQGSTLKELLHKLNKGIQDGPFSEVPVCTLLGRWHPKLGRLHLLNGGLPHGIRYNQAKSHRIIINGTPLGVFDFPMAEEKVLFLEKGDRLFFATDGFFETRDLEGQLIEENALQLWKGIQAVPIQDALSILAGSIQGLTGNVLNDDLLLVGFQQDTLQEGLLNVSIPSTLEAIDTAVDQLNAFLDRAPSSIPLTHSKRFDIVMALREGLNNAIHHGNQFRPDTQVIVRAWWKLPALFLAILDEGPGFDLSTLRLPLDPMAERGRGIPFLQHAASRVEMTDCELKITFNWGA